MLSLVWMHRCEGNAGVVVDSHEQRLPARAIHRVASIGRGAVAGTRAASEHIGVDVQHVPRRIVLVTNHRLSGLQIAEPCYLSGCEAALADASTRPSHSPRAIDASKAWLIVESRKPRMLQSRIARCAGVSASTVSRACLSVFNISNLTGSGSLPREDIPMVKRCGNNAPLLSIIFFCPVIVDTTDKWTKNHCNPKPFS